MARHTIMKAALLLAGLVPAAARADNPTPYVASPVEGLAVLGSDLVWKAGCGSGFTSTRSHIRTVSATAWPAGGDLPGGGLLGRGLYEPRGCGRDAVESRNVVADDLYVYFIDRGRHLMRIARSGGAPQLMAYVEPAAGAGYVLALSNRWIAWSNGAAVFRMRTDGVPRFTPVHAIFEPGGTALVGSLLPLGDGYVVRAGNRLHRLAPPPGGARVFLSTPIHGTENVMAFTVYGDEIVVAVPGSDGNYAVRALRPDGQVTYHLPAVVRPGDRVDHIAVAQGQLYWHIAAGHGGAGPIMRMALPGLLGDRVPVRITPDLRMTDSRFAFSAGYLFWTNPADRRLYRLSVGTPGLGPR
ncbi:MAG TPA: hypothetical protein VJS15_07815 [Allosphingosinicella sp.]|nr:hypothetical protein [Allosphingosinicella sp.]